MEIPIHKNVFPCMTTKLCFKQNALLKAEGKISIIRIYIFLPCFKKTEIFVEGYFLFF